jgi:hypothetical protein
MHYKKFREAIMKKILLTTATITLLATSLAGGAQAAESLEQIFTDATPYLDVRYRYEFADEDGRANDAHASTLRTRLGYQTGSYHGVSGVLEFENITQLGSDNYNDTINGRTDHPTVADPESTEVNQVYLQYDGIEDVTIKVGRQGINLDNHRFIGTVPWRQNNQTYDAGTLSIATLPDTTIQYGYIANVNRVLGEDSANGDWDSDSHFVNITNNSLPIGQLTGYGYFLDFEEDAPAVSSRTFGGFLKGKQAIGDEVNFNYYVEYARQSDHGDNPVDYDADYLHIAPGISWKGLTATLGYEVLGSDDGRIGFSTPLSTLHKFNGWADRFLNTPANGLEDAYIALKYGFGDCDCSVLSDVTLMAQYHNFESDENSIDYGTEFDFDVKKQITPNYHTRVRFAQYDADQFSTDITRVIFGIGAKF